MGLFQAAAEGTVWCSHSAGVFNQLFFREKKDGVWRPDHLIPKHLNDRTLLFHWDEAAATTLDSRLRKKTKRCFSAQGFRIQKPMAMFRCHVSGRDPGAGALATGDWMGFQLVKWRYPKLAGWAFLGGHPIVRNGW